MWTKYRFNHNEDSKLFLVSDSHWCHNKEFLYKKRGFNSIEEHDEVLVQRWNETVRPQDSVIHLGDFVLGAGKDSEVKAIEYFNKLNGNITLLWGNHVGGVRTLYKKEVQKILGPAYKDESEVYPVYYNDRIRFVGYYCLAQVKTPAKTHFVFCSHYAHRIWIDSNKGVLAASGHSHGSDKESNPESPSPKRLDVGVENFGKPLDFDEFLSIMDSKSITVLDHHDNSINPSF